MAAGAGTEPWLPPTGTVPAAGSRRDTSSARTSTPKTGTNTYNLANGGVSLSTSGGFLTDIQTQLDTAKQKIVAGTIKVATTP